MSGRQAIEAAMKERRVTQKQLAWAVGFKRQQNVSEAFKRDMKISLVIRMADALGYELVLRKQGVQDDSLVIDRKA